jgi:catechol 2,3-dioxygenase-like lactoylglutathione lyase family enzyme
MLGNRNAMPTIAVKNIDAARRFYEDTLGLTRIDSDEPGVLLFTSGDSTVLVYESQYAGTNKATAVTWVVGEDINAVVPALKKKGVTFEHYALPDTTRDGDVHVTGSVKAAWCKDPDGNILALVSR